MYRCFPLEETIYNYFCANNIRIIRIRMFAFFVSQRYENDTLRSIVKSSECYVAKS